MWKYGYIQQESRAGTLLGVIGQIGSYFGDQGMDLGVFSGPSRYYELTRCRRIVSCRGRESNCEIWLRNERIFLFEMCSWFKTAVLHNSKKKPQPVVSSLILTEVRIRVLYEFSQQMGAHMLQCSAITPPIPAHRIFRGKLVNFLTY